MNETLEFIKSILPWVVALVLGVLAFIIIKRSGGNNRERVERIREHVETGRRTVDLIQDGNTDAKEHTERAEQSVTDAQDRVRHGLDLVEEIRKRNQV